MTAQHFSAFNCFGLKPNVFAATRMFYQAFFFPINNVPAFAQNKFS